MTLREVAGALACPHCGAGLRAGDRALSCANGHSHDIARQGYVNLLRGAARTRADTADMVAARERFLARGHFAPLLTAVAATAQGLACDLPPGVVVDLGAGPGAYLAAVLGALPDRLGLALDLSKHAARRAARINPRAAAAVCDVWRALPLRDATAALALDVFAPRNGAEITRVLAPGGALLVVTPVAGHLAEVVGALDLLTVDADKPARVRAQLAPHLHAAGEAPLTFPMALDREDLVDLVAMGPNAWHVDAADLARRVRALPDPLAVTAAVTLSVHRR